MKKVFLDMGGNKGSGLRAFIKKYNMDNSWIIKTYEPNLKLNYKDHIKDLTEIYNIEIISAAVFDFTGKVKFSNCLINDEASSVNCLFTWKNWNHSSITEVDCIDILDILKEFDYSDFIVVKMDIEGSEYPVTKRLLTDPSIKKIKDLYVEWHNVEMENDVSREKLKNEIKNNQIKLFDWF